MMGKNHLITNVCSAAVLGAGVQRVKENTDLLGLHISSIASKLYDLAIPQSYIGLVICAFLFFIGTSLPDLDQKACVPMAHRTWSHAVWIPAGILIATIWYHSLIWLFLGYTLHLMWDSLSYCGICLFYPLGGYINYNNGGKVKKNHWLKLYRVGSKSETIVVSCVVFITVVIMSLTYMRPLLSDPLSILMNALRSVL